MSTGLETITVQEWLVSRLSGDSDLAAAAGGVDALLDRIWEGEYQGSADKNVDGFWWISYTMADTVDVKGVGLIQLMGRTQFQVKVVVRGESYLPALPIYTRVHALLENQLNAPTTDGIVLTCGRVSSFQFPDRTTGMEYRHLGSTYETLAQ